MRIETDRSGFTLLEVIIAVAIIAILAGAIGPVAYQQINQARQKATAMELEAIRDALHDYYEDSGEFPDPGIGLSALVSDPGGVNWRGPYLGAGFSDPLQAVTTDAFGQPYCYDSNPTLNPVGFAEIIVASGGVNRRLDMTNGRSQSGQTWNMSQTANYDDLIISVSIAPLDREKNAETREELSELGNAAKNYYLDNGVFPAQLSELGGGYISAGIDENAFIDGWNSKYVSWIDGVSPSTLSLLSCGPDRIDDSGDGDDLLLEINSAQFDDMHGTSGGTMTETMLRVAQDSVATHPGDDLAGDWDDVLARLGLPPGYNKDEWNRELFVNQTARVVYSRGADGNEWTLNDNVPTGAGP